jgi:hypothetical protein
MKKTAIILLALIVGLCLANGAFAQEKYMVILVEVDSGNVKTAYEANKLGSPDPNTPGVIILKCKKATPHNATLPTVISKKWIETYFAISSPGCRYIWHPAGYWVKVCSN